MKNPILHALVAGLYIIALVGLGNYFGHMLKIKETIVIPMAMLSLFVLSAACMGFLFLGEPLQLYLNDKKQEALQFFIQTVGSFAIIVALLFAVVIYLGR